MCVDANSRSLHKMYNACSTYGINSGDIFCFTVGVECIL